MRAWWHAWTVSIVVVFVLAGQAAAAGVPAQLSEAESEVLVQDQVQSLLAGFVAPPGSVVQTPPGPARKGPERFSQEASASREWLVPGGPAQAISWVEHHPPPGAEPAEVALEPPISGVPSSVTFRWADVQRARGPLQLSANVLPISGGGAELWVTAQGFWLRPRPAAEAVPARTRRLVITAALDPLPGSRRGAPRWRLRQPPVTVTDPVLIERVATLLNGLALKQPPRGPAPPCAAGAYEVALRLAFYDPAQRPPVAVFREFGDGGPCSGGTTLQLDGRVEPELDPGLLELPKEISAAVGMKLDLQPVRVKPVPKHGT